MKYISIGSVNRPSTEHIVYVSHCGYDYTLTADLAAVWLDGRFGFDQVRNQLQTKALRQLERMVPRNGRASGIIECPKEI